MNRWFGLVAALAAAFTLSCGDEAGGSADAIADRVLRIGEGVGTEVEIFEGKLPDNLEGMLNADESSDEPVSLPPLPDSKLIGSARVTRTDGLHTYFIMYEVKRDEAAVAEAARGLFDETPWQIVGGQSSEGVTAYRFQSTRSGDLVGTVVVQPLPTTDEFEVTVSRGGDEESLTLGRHAFTPFLGAELEEREGGVVVSQLGAGAGADAGLEEGDRIVRIGDVDVEDLASLGEALRGLGDEDDRLSSVIYIVQISPADPIASPFVLPDPRPIPRTFPAPFLVRDGPIPIAVEWNVEASGAVYQVLFISDETLADVADAYRDLLQQQNLTLTLDEAQGTATTLEFATADSQMIGSISIDTFTEDDAYTEATVQVQAAPGYTFSRQPAPAGTATPTPTPTRTP